MSGFYKSISGWKNTTSLRPLLFSLSTDFCVFINILQHSAHFYLKFHFGGQFDFKINVSYCDNLPGFLITDDKKLKMVLKKF